MTRQPLTPTRKKLLETYIACLKRTEARILRAHHVITGWHYSANYPPVNSRRFLHMVGRMKVSGFEPHAKALLCLRIARSKYAAELQGLEWR